MNLLPNIIFSLRIHLEPRYSRPRFSSVLMRLCDMDPKVLSPFFPRIIIFQTMRLSSTMSIRLMPRLRPGPRWSSCWASHRSPEVQYGWIKPALPSVSLCGLRMPRQPFWEKPSRPLAADLMARGCLWNSFVMVGQVHGFVKLFRHALPGLVGRFESIRRRSLMFQRMRWASFTRASRRYFLQDVLSVYPQDLAECSAAEISAESDLGEPTMFLSILDRKGVQPEWQVRTRLWRRIRTGRREGCGVTGFDRACERRGATVSAASGRKGRFVVVRKQNAALLKPRSDVEGPTQEASEVASNNAICSSLRR